MTVNCVLEIADYHGPYPGTFIPTLIATGGAVRERLGLDYHCAFPVEMRDRPWLDLLAAADIEVTFLDRSEPLHQRLCAVRDLTRRTRARVIRSHFTNWDMESALAGRPAGARVIWNVHTGNLTYGWRGHGRDLVKARTLSRLAVERVIAVSDEIGADLRRRGFPPSRIATVLNGIDVSRFDALPARSAARAELGLPRDGLVVLALGWTPHRKGVDVIVRALREPAPLEDVTLLVVGGDELRASLPDPLPGWVRVQEPVQDARVLYAAADVFVSASREEAFSYAIGEAMAARLPVVSSDIPGPAAYFDAPGLERYPPEDAAALRVALGAVLAGDRETAGAGNRAYVADRLSIERHVDEVVDVLTSALEAGGGRVDA